MSIQLRNQLAALSDYSVPVAETQGWTDTALWYALTSAQARINDDLNQRIVHQGYLLTNQKSAIFSLNQDNAKAAVSFRNRVLYQIVPAAITLAIASALVNVATFYSYFNPAPAAVGTDETCTKALTDCQTGLVTSKDLLEKCKGYIPTLKARRDDAMDDWEACLINLETYQNCTDATLATHADLLSRIEACNDTARNNTVN